MDLDPHLLIVDDDERIRHLLQKFLMRNGFLVTAARDAAHARRILDGLDFDMIICDVMMPQKNGYEVCEVLKQDERTSHIPIILLTAKSTQQDKLQGLAYGADAYLTKPFDKQELLIRLKSLVETRQQLQQLISPENFAGYASTNI